MEQSARQGLFEPPPTSEGVPDFLIDPAWSPARLSLAILRNVWPWLVAGSILLILSNTATALLPVAIGEFIDDVVSPLADGAAGGDVSTAVAWWVAGFVGLYVAIHVGYRYGGRMGWFGVQRSQYQLSQAVLGRILDRRGLAGRDRAPGSLLAIVSGDVRRACLVLYVAVYPPGEVVGLIVATTMLFLVHPFLGIGTVVGLPLVMGLMNLASRPLRRRSKTEQEGLADAAAAAADVVEGYRVLRGLHAHGTAASRYRKVSRTALRGTLAARRAEAAFEGIAAVMSRLFVVALVGGAATLALAEQISVGELVTVAGIAIKLVNTIESLAGVLASMWAVSQASAARVLDLVSTPVNPARLGTHGRVEAADLRFELLALPDGTVLDGVVRNGEFACVDLDKAGQHHVAEVLRAHRIADRGAVTLGGVPVHEFMPEVVRELILVPPRTPAIFDGTVLENVCMAGDIDDQVAEHALRTAGMAARELRDGYDTRVTDGGQELSGGQRQRIALARAIAADPEVLVLIEATSSVDSVTEQRIAEGLRSHRAGRTTIVVTASHAFASVADTIMRADSTESVLAATTTDAASTVDGRNNV